jgi:hypothetical protein
MRSGQLFREMWSLYLDICGNCSLSVDTPRHTSVSKPLYKREAAMYAFLYARSISRGWTCRRGLLCNVLRLYRAECRCLSTQGVTCVWKWIQTMAKQYCIHICERISKISVGCSHLNLFTLRWNFSDWSEFLRLGFGKPYVKISTCFRTVLFVRI